MRESLSRRAPSSRPLSAFTLGCALALPWSALAAPPARGTPPAANVNVSGLSPARLVVEKAPGLAAGGRQSSLVTASGFTFHRTERPVSSLRTVAVPDPAVQLHVWREQQPDGTRRDYMAYTRGGTELLGRVRDTEYMVRLEDARFDPLQGGQSLTGNLLAADADNTLHLVQFLGTPLPSFREAIEREGGKVLRFLTDHTFIVEMAGDTSKRVAELPYVRWVGPYHPEYRLERALRDALLGRSARLPETQRYSLMVGERGAARQDALARRVRALGGTVDLVEPGGLRVEATLTQEQLARVVRANEVQFIDRWGGPGEVDMDIVRELGGANALQALKGWTGQGVRGEVFDTELRTTHQEWPTTPIIHSTGTSSGQLHGTSCYSNNFARGVDPAARGMIPSGQGIFFLYSESTQFGGTKSRYTINQELTNAGGPYRAVFQTSSVGSALTTSYTTLSAEVDDYLFQSPILSTQSQSNAGSRQSRPQAWAKNIVSVGAFQHLNTLSRADDRWGSSGSIGPAADGRIKPDLSFFYDSIHSADGSGDASYTEFGGTSSATPQTAGHFGLLFQMWHQGVWAGHGGKLDVFTSRPQMATAKALMINHAWRYNWLAGGANGDIDRFKQGWGTSDVKRLLDRAPVTSIIDETDVVGPLGVKSYSVKVATGQTELNVTLAYTDPMGTVGAAQARINDLSLRVTAPNGTVYWGNNGLTAGNVSTPGGTSNKVDTVENVFLQNPAAGLWKVEVLGDEVIQDNHLETPAVDADFGLVVNGGVILVGDVSGNGCINEEDLNLVTAAFGQTVPPGNPAYDLDGSGRIDIFDRNIILQNYGKGCP
ncbi:S8 family serine peptidase [Corallococcus silvisoli]|uniref:S8 family serine peptidase n=1 Tax=Corallococcus silvisoli TaxID=2697031 RepID=UPI0013776607|nr:S8 family serine peptidase [Corallococcus silvisoli]NBD08932.1 S8 family serine peptidase [Corallococcus silvisoli]